MPTRFLLLHSHSPAKTRQLRSQRSWSVLSLLGSQHRITKRRAGWAWESKLQRATPRQMMVKGRRRSLQSYLVKPAGHLVGREGTWEATGFPLWAMARNPFQSHRHSLPMTACEYLQMELNRGSCLWLYRQTLGREAVDSPSGVRF